MAAIDISPLINTLTSLIPTILTLVITIQIFKLVIGLVKTGFTELKFE
jgi:hypothetical protein